MSQTSPEIKEVEEKIVKKAMEMIESAPENYWENLLRRLSAIKVTGIRKVHSGDLDKIIEQGWGIDDLEIVDIDTTYYGISVKVKSPNGLTAKVNVYTKSPDEMSKDEYIKFRDISNSLISRLKIAELEKEKKELENQIRDLNKRIEELMEEKRRVEVYCEDKKKECDVTYEDASNMLEFIREKGLLDEYLNWVNEKDREELKRKLLEYYGLAEDYDC